MINTGDPYIVVFNDNRQLSGVLWENHPDKIGVMDGATNFHIIPWTSIRELISVSGLGDDGDSGDGNSDGPDSNDRLYMLIPFSSFEDDDEDEEDDVA